MFAATVVVISAALRDITEQIIRVLFVRLVIVATDMMHIYAVRVHILPAVQAVVQTAGRTPILPVAAGAPVTVAETTITAAKVGAVVLK